VSALDGVAAQPRRPCAFQVLPVNYAGLGLMILGAE